MTYSRTGASDLPRVGGVRPGERRDPAPDLLDRRAVVVADRPADEARDLLHVALGHALRGDRRRADPDARGDRGRLRVVGDGVLVEHDARAPGALLGVLAGDADLAQVDE